MLVILTWDVRELICCLHGAYDPRKRGIVSVSFSAWLAGVGGGSIAKCGESHSHLGAAEYRRGGFWTRGGHCCYTVASVYVRQQARGDHSHGVPSFLTHPYPCILEPMRKWIISDDRHQGLSSAHHSHWYLAMLCLFNRTSLNDHG